MSGIIMSYPNMLFDGVEGQTNHTCQPVAGILGRVDAKHRSKTFTSWTIFLKVSVRKIVLPHRSAEAGPGNTCSVRVKCPHPRLQSGG